MSKILYGNVKKEDVQYEWKSESGACEVCQELDGTVYDTANDIPDRPHPNCKCWIEVLEREKETTDPIELRREQAKDKKRMQQELAKLLGDAKSLEEEIDEYMKQIEEQEEELNRIERAIDTDKLETADRRRLTDAKEQIDFAKDILKNLDKKAIATKKEINLLQKEILHNTDITNILNSLDKIYFILNILQEQLDNNFKKQFDRCISLFSSLMPISAILWKLATTKFQEGMDYINKNGIMYNTIDNIKDVTIKEFVKHKIEKQMQVRDSKGIVFNTDSEIANNIVDSIALRNYIKKYRNSFKPGAKLSITALDFNLLNLDLYNSIHKADLIDIKIGNDMTFYAQVVDTYDFNKGSLNPLVKIARHYQDEDKIENYYIIVNIEIPKSEWEKY